MGKMAGAGMECRIQEARGRSHGTEVRKREGEGRGLLTRQKIRHLEAVAWRQQQKSLAYRTGARSERDDCRVLARSESFEDRSVLLHQLKELLVTLALLLGSIGRGDESAELHDEVLLRRPLTLSYSTCEVCFRRWEGRRAHSLGDLLTILGGGVVPCPNQVTDQHVGWGLAQIATLSARPPAFDGPASHRKPVASFAPRISRRPRSWRSGERCALRRPTASSGLAVPDLWASEAALPGIRPCSSGHSLPNRSVLSEISVRVSGSRGMPNQPHALATGTIQHPLPDRSL
jgi:hypothetical protein